MNVKKIPALILALMTFSLPACHKPEEPPHHEEQAVVVTTPLAKTVVIPQQYVCQIRAKRYIEVCALEGGYLEPIQLKEGQAVDKDKLMFKIRPILYETRLAAEKAEYDSALIEYNNTISLYTDKNQVVSQKEVSLYGAKLAKAKAKYEQSKAELEFTEVKAPFTGIIDRLEKQDGSLVKEGEVLTTLSDNSVMWVFFNVPEARYLEFKGRYREENSQLHLADSTIELELANGDTFSTTDTPNKSKKPPVINTVRLEGTFNNKTGNIQFRADFPNPDRLLRSGQTGNVVINQTVKNAVLIPQRATFMILDKRFVYVVGKDKKVTKREIAIEHEIDDVFVIKSGLNVNEQIVLEGTKQVKEGQTLEEFEFRTPEEVFADQKKPAE
jgi:membrane fusion protein (multidrug efflux system)